MENMSHCSEKFDETIKSPSFVVDEMEGITWTLRIHPRESEKFNSDYIGVLLHIEEDDSTEDNVEVKFEVAFIGKDGSVFVSEMFVKQVLRKVVGMIQGHHFFCLKIPLRCTAECGRRVSQDVRYFACTRIGVEKRYIFCGTWKNPAHLNQRKKCTYLINQRTMGQ
ncbi:hypothetical protein AVEN_261576-1 [Araneus ventricosus]|uniref:MATH domain-containing protein n=1 Tax=Araneus ventricosus TaxID=182803 RepID=A0A4Y2E986_ARAVE|nr:hypothetical protein AVEN_261576-1 [Araneus ventricosus]